MRKKLPDVSPDPMAAPWVVGRATPSERYARTWGKVVQRRSPNMCGHACSDRATVAQVELKLYLKDVILLSK